MADLKKPFYFCSECKKVLQDLDDLLFIDEHSHKGFCSEECIEDFYFPLIKHYELVENSLRKKYNLLDETGFGAPADQELVDEVLNHPSEIFKQSNELNETYYHFIKHFNDFSVVVIASVYRKEASFVFFTCITRSKALLGEFRYGEQVSDWELGDDESPGALESHTLYDQDSSEDFDEEVDEDEDMVFIQLLESKKSHMLAEVLMKIKDNDIPFEDYSGYESCFQETLDTPDEVFEKKDKEGDVLFTYIKSYANFFYIVTCLKRKDVGENVNVYPILGLPTNDLELCQEFRGGTRLTGPLKN